MARNALHTSFDTSFNTAIDGIQSVWGPLSTEVVAACRKHLEDLLKASLTEDWLAALHREAPANKELYRDPTHGFVLLAHTEPDGLYRPPHDHGRAWVIYALQQGEIEVGTYARLEGPDGSVRLVKRGSTRVRPGQVHLAPALNPACGASDGALSGAFRAIARRPVARRWQVWRAGATFAARLLQTDAGATP